MTDASQLADSVAQFVAQHGKPYDPATDSYRRTPFAEPIKAGKNTAIYNAHSYHTKVPPQGIVPYIEHYTGPGDLVLDPFCGSGMTGVAGLLCGRNVILNDLSPAAVHIARNYCTPVDVEALKREFARIKKAVREEFDWLYGTTCDRCGGPATIQYTVWSDVFACGRCGHELALWDVAVDPANGKVREKFACPTCGAEWQKRQLRWLRTEPVLTNYECLRCKPKRHEHRTTDAEKLRIHEIEATPIPYWYPTTPFRQEDWEMWRGVHRDYGVDRIDGFFTKRNLRGLACLWQYSTLAGVGTAGALRFALSSVILTNSRMYAYRDTRKGGIHKGTLYIPALNCELNTLESFTRKVNDLTLPQCILDGTSHSIVRTLVGSATCLELITDGSIDYIFTDPPFGSNIFYADCNLIWEAWLNEGFTDQSQEAVVHLKHKNKNTLPDYARLMTESFHEMYRVLKPGRWASVVFHNSDDRIWQTILDGVDAAGFELAEVNAFDKEQLSFKGIRGQKGLERVTNKDLVLNLRKPAPGQKATTNGTVYADEQERRIVEAIAGFLDSNPPVADRTLQGIWNRALERMLRDGSVQVNMASVGEMLPHYFKSVDGCWYLRGEAVIGGNVFDLANDVGGLAWLHQILGNEPQTSGELIPDWQAATAHLGASDAGRLDRLLRENFWQDKHSGRWRIPTSAEREKMSARQSLADEAHLRTVRRYLDGKLVEQINDWKLFEWARFCYHQEAYAEALTLGQQINPARLDPEQAQALKRLLVVCRQRVGAAT